MEVPASADPVRAEAQRLVAAIDDASIRGAGTAMTALPSGGHRAPMLRLLDALFGWVLAAALPASSNRGIARAGRAVNARPRETDASLG